MKKKNDRKNRLKETVTIDAIGCGSLICLLVTMAHWTCISVVPVDLLHCDPSVCIPTLRQ